ncbi:hypothetical protein U9M48_021963 [Paspalum notatum var. saurae]|uniref:Uncharacterized protein n=1 Tax=Paspalum notatum var. saurae TaxID=547442 RepID=A0AAQ3TIS4_PASNO
MFVVGASYRALFEVVAARCSLEYAGFVSEVAEDGTLFCGVELVLPAPAACGSGGTVFFWSPVQTTLCGAYEQASLQAVSYLQSVYGFLVVDYRGWFGIEGLLVRWLVWVLELLGLRPFSVFVKEMCLYLVKKCWPSAIGPHVYASFVSFVLTFVLLPSLHPRDRNTAIRGNSMYAEIPTAEVQRKSPLVEEGKIYIISRFQVDPVAEDAVAMPELVYHITPFAQLEQRAGDQSRFTEPVNYLVLDVIRVLVEVSDTKVVRLTGKRAPTVTRDIIPYPFYISYQYKYKLAFVATDGTAEAQMVAFADVAARIIGKPVQQLMRAGRPIEEYPPNITAVLAMKFTFAVMLTDQSFDKPDKNYRVLSVLATRGRQTPVPRSVITAGTSKAQPQIIGSHQQQGTLEGETLEASAETDVPTGEPAQQIAPALPQTTSEKAKIATQPSQHAPAASNVQTTPFDKNRPALSSKKDMAKTSAAKNVRTTARRKLTFSEDAAPEMFTQIWILRLQHGAENNRNTDRSWIAKPCTLS